MTSIPDPIRGILSMLGASLFFSMMGAFIKYSTKDFSTMEVVFARSIVNVLILSPYMIRNGIPFIGANKWILFSRSLTGFVSLALVVYVTSVIPLADSAILNQTSVIFVPILSALIIKEMISVKTSCLIGLAFAGVVLIIKPSLTFLNIPGLMGLMGGFLAALSYVAIRKLHNTESSLTIVFSFSFFSAVASLCIDWGHFVLPNSHQFLLLLGVGVFGTLGQTLMTTAYKHAPAGVVAPYGFAGTIFSLIWGMIFWNEMPDIYSLLGMVVLILSGVGILKANS